MLGAQDTGIQINKTQVSSDKYYKEKESRLRGIESEGDEVLYRSGKYLWRKQESESQDTEKGTSRQTG